MLIVVVLFLATARVIFVTEKATKPANALDVVVIGHQYLVGVSLSQAGNRDRERVAHPGKRSAPSHADLSDNVVGRYRS